MRRWWISSMLRRDNLHSSRETQFIEHLHILVISLYHAIVTTLTYWSKSSSNPSSTSPNYFIKILSYCSLYSANFYSRCILYSSLVCFRSFSFCASSPAYLLRSSATARSVLIKLRLYSLMSSLLFGSSRVGLCSICLSISLFSSCSFRFCSFQFVTALLSLWISSKSKLLYLTSAFLRYSLTSSSSCLFA